LPPTTPRVVFRATEELPGHHQPLCQSKCDVVVFLCHPPPLVLRFEQWRASCPTAIPHCHYKPLPLMFRVTEGKRAYRRPLPCSNCEMGCFPTTFPPPPPNPPTFQVTEGTTNHHLDHPSHWHISRWRGNPSPSLLEMQDRGEPLPPTTPPHKTQQSSTSHLKNCELEALSHPHPPLCLMRVTEGFVACIVQ